MDLSLQTNQWLTIQRIQAEDILQTPNVLIWLTDRFNGVPVTPGCTYKQVGLSLATAQATAVSAGMSLVSSILGAAYIAA